MPECRQPGCDKTRTGILFCQDHLVPPTVWVPCPVCGADSDECDYCAGEGAVPDWVLNSR